MSGSGYKRVGSSIVNTDTEGYQSAVKRRQNEKRLEEAYSNIKILMKKYYQLEANVQSIYQRLEKLENE